MKLSRPAASAVIAFLSVCGDHALNAQTSVTFLPLTDDAWLSGGSQANLNLGAVSDIFVHNYSPKEGLVRFDASSIAGQTVTEAWLSFFMNDLRSAPGRVDIYAITSGWNEETVTYALRPQVEPAAVQQWAVAFTDVGTTISVEVTDVVQRWANGTLPDAGFLFATPDPIRMFLDAKEKAGGRPMRLRVTTGPTPPGEPGVRPRVLDLSQLPVIIDEPGHYVLDRDWRGGSGLSQAISIPANEVLLDLAGFEIDFLGDGNSVNISGSRVELRNGRIFNNGQGFAVASTGLLTILDGLYLFGDLAAVLSGNASVIKHSRLLARFGSRLRGADSTLEWSDLECSEHCIWTTGDRTQVIHNRLRGCDLATIRIQGSDTQVVGNVLPRACIDAQAILVEGNRNQIVDNVMQNHPWGFAAIVVAGTANIVRDNLATVLESPPLRTGIVFMQDGNFYGDNQMQATVPFDLGATTQIDWGGNVGF